MATVFYFENETRNSVKVYMFRFFNIPSTNQCIDHLDTPHAARAGHRRVKSLLLQCPKSKAKMCDFRRELFS